MNLPESAMTIEEAVSHATDTRECIIGEGTLPGVAGVLKRQFPEAAGALVVADPRTWNAAGERGCEILKSSGIAVSRHVIEPGGAEFHPEYRYVREIEEVFGRLGARCVPVAVGSGVINDLVKCAAGEMSVPYMVVATAASVDGYSSYGAAIISPNGVKETHDCPAPRAILADVDVLLSAPRQMAAFGYADLLAKSPAGAEWILAAEIGATEWNEVGWRIVQDALPAATADAEGVASGDRGATARLMEGLMLGGFAMQHVRNSRPASGAEHRFSHILDMTHHTFRGRSCSHGEQVGVFTLYMTRFMEELMKLDMAELDVEKCVSSWQEWDCGGRRQAAEAFAGTAFPDLGVRESVGKWQTKAELRETLERARSRWPTIVGRIQAQLIPSGEIERRLKAVGSPSAPEEIGVAKDFAARHVRQAMFMRFRYNVLDFAFRIGRLDELAAAAVR